MNFLVDVLPGARPLSILYSYRLEVELRIGETMFLDLEKLIRQWNAYWRLRQSRNFSTVSVNLLGGICWSEGEDLAPDGLDRHEVSKG